MQANVPALVMTAMALQASSDEAPYALDMEVADPGSVTLGMPLDVSVAATPRTSGSLSYQCFGIWLLRQGKWERHHEADFSLGDGVPGGVPGGRQIGHRYDLQFRVHLENDEVYGTAKLAFPAARSYRLRVTYHETCTLGGPTGPAVATSNEISIRVVRPPEKDRLVFEDAILKAPELLDPRLADVADPDGRRRKALLAKYPESIYAPLWRVRED
jgi:hypothetical protein